MWLISLRYFGIFGIMFFMIKWPDYYIILNNLYFFNFGVWPLKDVLYYLCYHLCI
jgi:hypothetical protein